MMARYLPNTINSVLFTIYGLLGMSQGLLLLDGYVSFGSFSRNYGTVMTAEPRGVDVGIGMIFVTMGALGLVVGYQLWKSRVAGLMLGLPLLLAGIALAGFFASVEPVYNGFSVPEVFLGLDVVMVLLAVASWKWLRNVGALRGSSGVGGVPSRNFTRLAAAIVVAAVVISASVIIYPSFEATMTVTTTATWTYSSTIITTSTLTTTQLSTTTSLLTQTISSQMNYTITSTAIRTETSTTTETVTTGTVVPFYGLDFLSAAPGCAIEYGAYSYAAPCFSSTPHIFDCATAAATPQGCTQLIHITGAPNQNFTVTVWYPLAVNSGVPSQNCKWIQTNLPTPPGPDGPYYDYCFYINSTSFLVAMPAPGPA